MTATPIDLEAFGHYASARHWARAAAAVATTSEDLRSAENEEVPTASVEDQVWSGFELVLVGDPELTHTQTGKPRSSSDFSLVQHLDLLTRRYDVTWTTRASADSPAYDPPTFSPFQMIDERRSEADKVSELIKLVRRLDELPFAEELAKRLEKLVCIAQEEAPDQSEMSSDSLRTFVRFLKYHPDLAQPGVVLTPSGIIRAQWRAAPNKLCAAEFLGDERVNFVVFAPDSRDARRTFRLSGLSLPIEKFMSAVEPHGAAKWMKI